MKKIVLIMCLIVPLWSCAQSNGTPIFSISSGTISINNQFIDNEYDDPEVADYPYGLGNTVGVQVGSVTYSVKTAIYTGSGWDTDPDPGYYIIEISTGGQIKFIRKQSAALIAFNDNSNYYGPGLRQYADNDYFIKAPLSNEATALIFAGWPYASDPEQLLIVVLTPTDVKVAYNQSMTIRSVTQSGYNFSMVIQSNVLEDNGMGGFNGTPILHTIYQQDGVLYFKNN